MDIVEQIKMEERTLSQSVEWVAVKIDNILVGIDIEESKEPPSEEKLDNLQSQLKFWYNRVQLEGRNAAKFEIKHREFLLSGQETTA